MKPLRICIGLKCLVVAATLLLSACAFGPDTVNHVFEYDTWIDSPDAEVLDYEYGNSQLPGVRPSVEARRLDEVGQQTLVHGAMLRGDFLYVKWRIRKTGQVFEDRVDLRKRLPSDLTNCRIHFVLNGSQLRVYVVYPQAVNGLCQSDIQKSYRESPPERKIFIEYCNQKIVQIYPGESLGNEASR